ERRARPAERGEERPVRLEPGLERDLTVQDSLDEAAALGAEIDRGANALGGERQALPRRVSDGEHAPHRGAQEPIREVRPVVRPGSQPLPRHEALERRPELRAPDVRAEPDETPRPPAEDPAPPPRDQLLIEEEPEPLVAPLGMRL